MKTPVRFAKGDSVLHPKRPEWGTGKVRAITALAQPDGSTAQRLTVDFANHGRVVLNTAVAPLIQQAAAPPVVKRLSPRLTPSDPIASGRPAATSSGSGAGMTLAGAATATATASAGSNAAGGSGASGGSGGWLAQLDRGAGSHELWDLPHALTDAFASLGDRLAATLQTYRFSTEPRSILDWATAQTGVNDPLSRYTRSEMEQAFPRFARNRDQHLRDLVRQLKRKDDFATLKECGRGLFAAAQSALDKAMRS